MKYIIFLSVLLFFVTNVNAQRFKALTEEDTLDYSSVKMQALDINGDSDLTSFEMFDSIVEKSNIFFAGENHGFRVSNTKIQIKLIDYLYKKAGVRTVIMEFGYSRGWLVDKYINSEDTSDMKNILGLYSFKEYSWFYDKLRDFNLQLPDSARIHVAGIDVERFNDLPIRVLSMLLPDSTPPDSIALNVEALRGMAGFLDDYLKGKKKDHAGGRSSGYLFYYSRKAYNSGKTSKRIVEDFQKHRIYYKEYLGDNFDDYEKIINELIDQQEYEDYEDEPHQYVYRERYLYRNFMKYMNEHPGEKVFGQFGRCHVATGKQDKACLWYNFDALASRINKTNDDWLKDKVCSFAYFYNDDETFNNIINDNGRIKKLLEMAGEIDTVVAIEVTDDSLLFGNFPAWYKFIIYNNKTKKEESEDLYSDYEYEEEGNMAFYLSLRRPYFNLNTLNNFLVDNNYNAITKEMNIISFGIQFNNYQDVSIGFNGQVLFESDIPNYQDTSGVLLNGGTFVYNFGYDFLKSKNVILKPSIGLGYNFYKMKFYQGQQKIIRNKDIFGGDEVQVFNNHAFIMDFGAEVIFKLKFIGVGLKYGYVWDTSKGYWKNMDKIIINSSPVFKVTGQYFQAGLYLMFDY